MTTTPEEIRDEIERTRGDLSHDVNQLADAVDPRQVAQRQVEKVKDAVTGEGGVATRARRAPEQATGWARRQTSSNPWAAGLVAVGVGWLVGSLLPASQAERRAADKVVEQAKPLLDSTAGPAISEMGEHLKEPMNEAVDAVKDSATEAASRVKETATE